MWAGYKKLSTGKKVLLFVPLLILIILVIVLMFWKSDSVNEAIVDYGKKKVDKEIKRNKEKDNVLEKQSLEIEEQKEEVKKEIKENESNAVETNKSIVNAVNSNDITELQRIHKQLNSRRSGATTAGPNSSRTN